MRDSRFVPFRVLGALLVCTVGLVLPIVQIVVPSATQWTSVVSIVITATMAFCIALEFSCMKYALWSPAMYFAARIKLKKITIGDALDASIHGLNALKNAVTQSSFMKRRSQTAISPMERTLQILRNLHADALEGAHVDQQRVTSLEQVIATLETWSKSAADDPFRVDMLSEVLLWQQRQVGSSSYTGGAWASTHAYLSEMIPQQGLAQGIRAQAHEGQQSPREGGDDASVGAQNNHSAGLQESSSILPMLGDALGEGSFNKSRSDGGGGSFNSKQIAPLGSGVVLGGGEWTPSLIWPGGGGNLDEQHWKWREIDEWGFDVVVLDEATGGHALSLLFASMLRKLGLVAELDLDLDKLHAFLLEAERRYGSNPYHNRMHGADVLLGVYRFLTQFGVMESLTPLQKLGSLFAAALHDFNHPGSSNAHELKAFGRLAVRYSDASPLEHHHLESAFTLLHTPQCFFLDSIGRTAYHDFRATVISMVLATDLKGHFEFISRLKVLSPGALCLQAAADTRRAPSKSRRPSAGQIATSAAQAIISPAAGSPHASPMLSSVSESETAVASMAPTTAALRSARNSRERTASPALDPMATAATLAPSGQGQLPLTLDASTHSNFSTHSHAHSNGTAPSTQAGGNPSMDLQFILAAAIKFCDLGTCVRACGVFQLEGSLFPFSTPPQLPAPNLCCCPLTLHPLSLSMLTLPPTPLPGHACKPWIQHERWTSWVAEEFYLLGDKEKALGYSSSVGISAMCDRDRDLNLPQMQVRVAQPPLFGFTAHTHTLFASLCLSLLAAAASACFGGVL